MKRFADIPDDDRMKIRCVLEDEYGCYFVGYHGRYATVAMPVGDLTEVHQAIKDLGLKIDERYYFPLGSDKPKMHLRHNSRRYNVKACQWLLYKITPIEVG